MLVGLPKFTDAVGAHLANAAAAGACELFYWRERNHEMDFVVRAGRRLLAIEVKSGRSIDTHARHGGVHGRVQTAQHTLLVGGDGTPLEEFLTCDVAHWIAP